jgi:hypothetical protein
MFLLLVISLLFSSCGKEDGEPEETNTNIKRITEAEYLELIGDRLERMNMPRPEGSYSYLVYPGTAEWDNIRTEEAKLMVSQVPEEQLSNMSTQAVIQAIWEYPLLPEIFRNNQYFQNFNTHFLENNAYRKLSGRSDAVISLLERIERVPFQSMEWMYSEVRVIELCLARSLFLNQLSQENREHLLELILSKEYGLWSLTKGYGMGFLTEENPGTVISCILLGKILLAAGYEPVVEAVAQSANWQDFLDERGTYTYTEANYGDIPRQIQTFAEAYYNRNFPSEEKTDEEYLAIPYLQPKLERMNMPRPQGSYNYPLYPGTPEWVEQHFKNSFAMMMATQVPEERLRGMSTQAVIQAIWEYPLGGASMYSDYMYITAYDHTILRYKMYSELVTRSDAGLSLLERLECVLPADLGYPFSEARLMQLTLAHPVFLNQLSREEIRRLVKVTIDKETFIEQNPVPGISGSYHAEISWVLVGRALTAVGYQPFIEATKRSETLQYFLAGQFEYEGIVFNYVYMAASGWYGYGDIPQQIQAFAEAYLAESE